jgi:hypothetical protein
MFLQMAHSFMSSGKQKSLIHFMRKISWLLQAAIFVLAACNHNSEVEPQGSPSTIVLPNGKTIKTCNTIEWAFNAGGSLARKTGTVTVSNDNKKLYVRVYSEHGFQNVSDNLKIFVASSLDLIPQHLDLTKWKVTLKNGEKEHTFIIPLKDVKTYKKVTGSTPLYLFIHGDIFIDNYGTKDYASGGTTCGRPTNCGCSCYGIYHGKSCSRNNDDDHSNDEVDQAEDEKRGPKHKEEVGNNGNSAH